MVLKRRGFFQNPPCRDTGPRPAAVTPGRGKKPCGSGSPQRRRNSRDATAAHRAFSTATCSECFSSNSNRQPVSKTHPRQLQRAMPGIPQIAAPTHRAWRHKASQNDNPQNAQPSRGRPQSLSCKRLCHQAAFPRRLRVSCQRPLPAQRHGRGMKSAARIRMRNRADTRDQSFPCTGGFCPFRAMHSCKRQHRRSV